MEIMEDDPTSQTSLNWVAGKTRNGKTIRVKPNGIGLFFIELIGGGKKPKALMGEFTSVTSAQETVDRYLVSASYVHKRDAMNKAEEESNAKSTARTSKR